MKAIIVKSIIAIVKQSPVLPPEQHFKMTEIDSNKKDNLYGLFVECFEDVAFDGTEKIDDDEWFLDSVNKKSSRRNTTVFGKMFRAVEKINMCESTDSLTSYASMSSMGSGKDISQADLSMFFSPEMMMGAVESLTLNNYGSANSLASMDYSPKGQSIQSPDNMIQFFFHALEIFINKSDEDEVISSEFPKFC